MPVTNFYVTLKENSYSVANNTSSVTANVYIVTTSSSYNLTGNASGTLRFGGNGSGSYNFSAKFGRGATTLLYSKTITVKHNADGSGSCSVSVSFNTHISAGVVSANASLTLHKIARASKPSVSGTKELGQTLTINMNRASNNYTHTVRWSWAGQSGTIGTGIGASTTWTPQLAYASYLTNAESAKCTLTTTTYNGSTVIGTSEVSFDLAVQSAAVPTISAVTIDDLEGYFTNYQAFIAGYSKIKADITAASVYGATIASYKLFVGASSVIGTSNSLTLDKLESVTNLFETVNLTVTVIDTRGRSASQTKQVTVANYFVQGANDLSIKRWDTTGNKEDDESTTVRVHIDGSLFQVNGQGITMGTVKVEYKERSETQYTTHQTQNVSGSYNLDFDVENIDSAKVYDFNVIITDAFNQSITYASIIPTATPIMDFKSNGKGLAILGVSVYDGFHVNGDMILTRNDGTGAAILGMAKDGEHPYPVLNSFPDSASPDQQPTLQLGGGYYGDSEDWLRVYGLQLMWQKYLGGDFASNLWTGTWSSGTVNIPNSSKYRAFAIRSGNTSGVDLGVTFAFKDEISPEYTKGTVTGIGGYCNDANNSQFINGFYAEYEGDSWTLKRNNYVTHNASGNHSAGQTRPVWQVWGLF